MNKTLFYIILAIILIFNLFLTIVLIQSFDGASFHDCIIFNITDTYYCINPIDVLILLIFSILLGNIMYFMRKKLVKTG